jgi:hypothetical protein
MNLHLLKIIVNAEIRCLRNKVGPVEQNHTKKIGCTRQSKVLWKALIDYHRH